MNILHLNCCPVTYTEGNLPYQRVQAFFFRIKFGRNWLPCSYNSPLWTNCRYADLKKVQELLLVLCAVTAKANHFPQLNEAFHPLVKGNA